MRAIRPLIPIDPGWLFIASGLAMFVAVMLIPPQQQLHDLTIARQRLVDRERMMVDRLRAHADFLSQIDRMDQAVMARLVSAQLNYVRRGDVAMFEAASASMPVTDWIDMTVPLIETPEPTFPQTRLVELVSGENRHWIMAGSALSLFIGLLLQSGSRIRVEDELLETTDGAGDAAQLTAVAALVEEREVTAEHAAGRALESEEGSDRGVMSHAMEDDVEWVDVDAAAWEMDESVEVDEVWEEEMEVVDEDEDEDEAFADHDCALDEDAYEEDDAEEWEAEMEADEDAGEDEDGSVEMMDEDELEEDHPEANSDSDAETEDDPPLMVEVLPRDAGLGPRPGSGPPSISASSCAAEGDMSSGGEEEASLFSGLDADRR